MAIPFRPLLQRAVNYAWARGWIRRGANESLQRRQFARAYKGASMSRLTASQDRSPTTADSELMRDLRTLRARSRELGRNSGYMRRFLKLLQTNVVGPTGVSLQSTVVTARGKPREGVNKAIEAAWAAWGKQCGDTEFLSWLDVQNLALTSAAEDGEFFVELVFNSSRFGLSLRVHDAELVDVDHNVDNLAGGGYIRMGIEYDKQGRVRGYWLRTISKDGRNYDGDSFASSRTTENRFIPAASMLHGFQRDRVGQTRGVPWTSSVMWRHHQQEGYEDAAVTAARVGASKMGFFKGGEQSYDGTDEDAEGNPLIDGFTPGGIETLPEGVDFESFNPDYPHAQFASFSKHMLQSISAGLNVSYASLSNDLEGVNFSSIRAGVLEDREVFKGMQTWLVERLHERVFKEFLIAALRNGAVSTPNAQLKLTDIDTICRPHFQGRRWAWVDPLKDISAQRASYDMGATSLSAIIRETGRDPEDVWRERKREAALLDQLGVTVGPQPINEDEAASNASKKDDD
jgi:lambda family phage portal protein